MQIELDQRKLETIIGALVVAATGDLNVSRRRAQEFLDLKEELAGVLGKNDLKEAR
jgi:hypothetical protein